MIEQKEKNSIKSNLSKNISKDIDDVLNSVNKRQPVKLREHTPKILVKYGIKDLPMYENPAHIRKNILTEKEAKKLNVSINTRDHYHGLGKCLFIKVIASLDNPRAIFKNKNGKDYLILTIIKDKDDNNIIVPIEIETTTIVNKIKIKINRIKTIYGYKNNISSLNNYIKKHINNGNLTKIYEQKKKNEVRV